MKATRRDFIKNLALTGASLSLPRLAQGQMAPGMFAKSRHSWSSLPPSAFASRQLPVGVMCGAKLIILGGTDGAVITYYNDGYVYDFATGAWTGLTLGSMTGRYNHSATWTGVKVVYWGGQGSAIYNTGCVYDPVLTTQSATTTTGAPTPAYNHSAVWNGTQVIVWGGQQPSYTNTGGRYDPSLNSWTSTSTVSAPSVRASHTAVYTGTQMLVWGGITTASVYVNTGGRYNNSGNTWSTMLASPLSARSGHTAVWTGTRMLIWGGTNGSVLGDGASYDPVGDTWTSIATAGAPSARTGHTAVWTGSRMLVWGGYSPPTTYMNDGAAYDPISNSWTPMVPYVATPAARYGHFACWDAGSGQMFVTGGQAGGFWLNTLHAYKG